MKTIIQWLVVLFGFQYATGQACTATITASGPTTFCEGDRVVLTANTDGGKNWIQKADFGGGVRYRAASFSIGEKGYVGTGMDNGLLKGDFWEYNPAFNTWTQKANFAGGPRQGAVGFGIGSKGYIGTGEDYSPGNKNDFWEYDPSANTWTQKTNFGGSERYEASGFCIGSKGYIGLGNSNSSYLNDFWEYDPIQDQWTQKADFEGSKRSGATGFSIDSKGYIGTGYDGSGYYNDFWEFNPAINSWTQKASFGGVNRGFAIGFSVSHKGYLGTGYTPGSIYAKDFWEYDPLSNSWLQIDNTDVLGRLVAFGFSIGNKGYMGGGNSQQGLKNDFWEYSAGNILSYQWSNGETTPSITVTTTGQYFVSIKNSAGCIATSDPVFVQAGAPSTPSIMPSGPITFCEGDSVILTANTSSDNTIPENYNPWFQKANFGGTARHGATGFSIGNKGYIGLGNDGIPGVSRRNDFWEYDPQENLWTQKANFGGTARIGAAGFSINNKGYIGIGTDNNGLKKDFWEYDLSTNNWTQRADFGGNASSVAVGFSIGNKGYIGLGQDEEPRASNREIWEYDPSTDRWLQKANFPGEPRLNAVGFAIANKGYIGTGWNEEFDLLKDFWEYNPVTDGWIQRADFAGTPRQSAVGFGIGNKGYIGTGSLTNDFWEYDPVLNTWDQKFNFGGAARSGATGFSIGNKGYIGTGFSLNTANQDFWEYCPWNAYNYKWSTGATSSSITVNSSGNYTVTISNCAGCTAISAPTVVSVNPGQLSIDCPVNMVVAPSTLSGAIVSYQSPVIYSSCPPVSMQQTAGLASGSLFPIGITTNIFKGTDASGNYATCSFTVTVIDPYCSKAVGNKKVYVCHKGETICLSINALKMHLNHGDYLGACSNNDFKVFTQKNPSGITVFPNPTHGKFALRLNNLKAPKAVVTIMDSKGAIIERRILYEKLYPVTIDFDLGLKPIGNYRVKVETKHESFSTIVVLQ